MSVQQATNSFADRDTIEIKLVGFESVKSHFRIQNIQPPRAIKALAKWNQEEQTLVLTVKNNIDPKYQIRFTIPKGTLLCPTSHSTVPEPVVRVRGCSGRKQYKGQTITQRASFGHCTKLEGKFIGTKITSPNCIAGENAGSVTVTFRATNEIIKLDEILLSFHGYTSDGSELRLLSVKPIGLVEQVWPESTNEDNEHFLIGMRTSMRVAAKTRITLQLAGLCLPVKFLPSPPVAILATRKTFGHNEDSVLTQQCMVDVVPRVYGTFGSIHVFVKNSIWGAESGTLSITLRCTASINAGAILRVHMPGFSIIEGTSLKLTSSDPVLLFRHPGNADEVSSSQLDAKGGFTASGAGDFVTKWDAEAERLHLVFDKNVSASIGPLLCVVAAFLSIIVIVFVWMICLICIVVLVHVHILSFSGAL